MTSASRLIDLLAIPFLDGLLVRHLGVFEILALARVCWQGRRSTARACGRFEVLWRHATTHRHGALCYLCSRLVLYPMSARKLIQFGHGAGFAWKGMEGDHAVQAQLPLETVEWLHRLGVPIRETTIPLAASSGRMDLVVLLSPTGVDRAALAGVRCAVVAQQWHVVKYLVQHNKIRRSGWLARNAGYFLGRAQKVLQKRIALVERVDDTEAETEDGMWLTDIRHRQFENQRAIAREALAALPSITETLIELGAVIEPDSGDSD